MGGSINEMGSIKCYYFPKATLVCLNHSMDYSMPVICSIVTKEIKYQRLSESYVLAPVYEDPKAHIPLPLVETGGSTLAVA